MPATEQQIYDLGQALSVVIADAPFIVGNIDIQRLSGPEYRMVVTEHGEVPSEEVIFITYGV